MQSKLVADVQVSKITSHYNWLEKQCKTKEFCLEMKTSENNFNLVEKFIKENHSYTTPQIISIPIVSYSQEYASWINENVKGIK